VDRDFRLDAFAIVVAHDRDVLRMDVVSVGAGQTGAESVVVGWAGQASGTRKKRASGHCKLEQRRQCEGSAGLECDRSPQEYEMK